MHKPLFRNIFSAKSRWLKLSLNMLIALIFVLSPLNVKAMSICGPACKLQRGVESIAEAIENFDIDINDRDLQVLFESTENLVNYSRIQAQALVEYTNDEYQESLIQTMSELTEYTETLDALAKARIGQVDTAVEGRIDQVDAATEARIRQTLEGIKQSTLLISSEFSKQIRAAEEGAKSTSTFVREDVQRATRTASDELQAIIGLTEDKVDKLLNSTSRQLINVMGRAGAEGSALLKLISKEIQANIELLGNEAQEFSLVTLGEFKKTAEATLEKHGEVHEKLFRVTVSEIENSSRLLLADSAGHAIDITNNLSFQTQEVIRTGRNNLEELASHVTQEVLIINEEIKESRLQVIEGGLFFIDHFADLVIKIVAVVCLILFPYISSQRFTVIFFQREQWPQHPTQKMIFMSALMFNIVACFAPGVFLLPNVRLQVLMPLAQAKEFHDVIPKIGCRLPRENSNTSCSDLKGNKALTLLETDQNNIAGATTTPSNTERSQYFFDAVRKANRATELSQSAQSNQDWQRIAGLWKEASNLMKAVESYTSDYATAQEKIGEYQSYSQVAAEKSIVPTFQAAEPTARNFSQNPVQEFEQTIELQSGSDSQRSKIKSHINGSSVKFIGENIQVPGRVTKAWIKQKGDLQDRGAAAYIKWNDGVISSILFLDNSRVRVWEKGIEYQGAWFWSNTGTMKVRMDEGAEYNFSD